MFGVSSRVVFSAVPSALMNARCTGISGQASAVRRAISFVNALTGIDATVIGRNFAGSAVSGTFSMMPEDEASRNEDPFPSLSR